VSMTAPAAGSRVDLHGKITVQRKQCTTTGTAPTITIKKVDIHLAKAVAPMTSPTGTTTG